MVQAIININEKANRVLNIVKAKYGLKDKSAAIEMVAKEYEEALLEPTLRPEYMGKAQKTMKAVRVGTVKKLSKGMETAIASEQVLAKEWDTKEEDEAWKDL